MDLDRLIHRGRVRHWKMPEKVWEKIADFEEFEGEGAMLADYQPKVMRALLAHWQPAVVRLLTRGKARKAKRRRRS